MIHLIFDRPHEKLSIWKSRIPKIIAIYTASGAAVGDGVSGPYGHFYPIAPGHYKLGLPQRIDPPIISEGAWQIPVYDLTAEDASRLAASGVATGNFEQLNIGGTTLPAGQLAKWKREAIFIHGGGSALGVPGAFADFQELLPTLGCTRMHNKNLAELAELVCSEITANILIFSAVGDPK